MPNTHIFCILLFNFINKLEIILSYILSDCGQNTSKFSFNKFCSSIFNNILRNWFGLLKGCFTVLLMIYYFQKLGK